MPSIHHFSSWTPPNSWLRFELRLHICFSTDLAVPPSFSTIQLSQSLVRERTLWFLNSALDLLHCILLHPLHTSMWPRHVGKSVESGSKSKRSGRMSNSESQVENLASPYRSVLLNKERRESGTIIAGQVAAVLVMTKVPISASSHSSKYLRFLGVLICTPRVNPPKLVPKCHKYVWVEVA